MKNNVIVTFVAAIVVGALGFVGGMQYGKMSVAKAAPGTGGPGGQFSGRQFGNGAGPRGAQGGGFTNGQILSKDDKSITVSLRNGGSQIIFLSGSTQIMKAASGTTQDLTVGEQVTANGTANSDGSINAAMIQIRPAMPNDQQRQGSGPSTVNSNSNTNTNQSAPTNPAY